MRPKTYTPNPSHTHRNGAWPIDIGAFLRRFFRRRPKPRLERCESCNAALKPKRVHEVTATLTDTEFSPTEGSSISATFCPDHCPGNCDKEHTHARAA